MKHLIENVLDLAILAILAYWPQQLHTELLRYKINRFQIKNVLIFTFVTCCCEITTCLVNVDFLGRILYPG